MLSNKSVRFSHFKYNIKRIMKYILLDIIIDKKRLLKIRFSNRIKSLFISKKKCRKLEKVFNDLNNDK